MDKEIIQIWEPRYKDDMCLIATYKVKDGPNYIQFTKAKHLKKYLYQVDGERIKKCGIQTNGKIDVYAVPMSMLERVIGYTGQHENV